MEAGQPQSLDPPLHVDWLPDRSFADGLPGRLGLTFLPGKRGASLRYPGRIYRRELDRDLGMLADAGVRRLILLVDDAELARWGDPRIIEEARAHAIEVERFPIPDGQAPSARGEMDEILAAVRHGRQAGDVAVACMGGVGRTGTVAACALVSAGMAPDAAIAEVRRVRHPTAVETPAQEAFVRDYARHGA